MAQSGGLRPHQLGASEMHLKIQKNTAAASVWKASWRLRAFDFGSTELESGLAP